MSITILRKISMLLVFLFVFSPLMTSIALANPSDNDSLINEFQIIEVDDLNEYVERNNIDIKSSSTVVIFVLGVLTGYIVDGVIIYATGQSAGQWVSDALSYFAKYKGVVKNIFCTKTEVTHISNSGGCVLRAGGNHWLCPHSI